jgi:excisionase family DNA binding protein
MFSINNQLLTIDDVADECRVSKRTVFRWMSDGGLNAVRIGNITRIRREDLDRFFEAHLRSKAQPTSGGTA